jgi:hypothetical protein
MEIYMKKIENYQSLTICAEEIETLIMQCVKNTISQLGEMRVAISLCRSTDGQF